MSKIFCDCENLDREAWLRARRSGIGGSDVGAICGVNKWKNPLDVYLDKLGDNDEDEQEQNEYAYWGTVLEEIVAEEFEKRTGKKVLQYNYIFQHDDIPYLLANVDREVTGENSGLECKTASLYKLEEWQNGIPESYELQCHHYMSVMGYDKMYIACLVGGQHFFIHEIYRDEEIIESITKLCKDFWTDHVEKKKPPYIGDSECLNNETLIKAYPAADEGSSIDLGSAIQYDVAELERLKVTKKEIEGRIAIIETGLKQRLGANENGQTGQYRISWKNSTRNSFDAKKFKQDHPEMHELYAKTKNTRILKIKKVEE